MDCFQSKSAVNVFWLGNSVHDAHAVTSALDVCSVTGKKFIKSSPSSCRLCHQFLKLSNYISVFYFLKSGMSVSSYVPPHHCRSQLASTASALSYQSVAPAGGPLRREPPPKSRMQPSQFGPRHDQPPATQFAPAREVHRAPDRPMRTVPRPM